MKKKIFLVLLVFLAAAVLFPFSRKGNSALAECRGEQWENWCGGDFRFPFPSGCPFPTLKPCPKPTCPPTPTPTTPPGVTPTPTPTLVPGQPTPTPTLPAGGETPSGGGGGTGGVGGSTPYHCGAVIPPNAPTLLSVSSAGTGKMDIAWTPVDGVTHYSLVYGPSSGNYLYGVSNTGNVTSFTVGGLDPGKNYCFAVQGVNDCAPGPLSNERCSGAVLGVAEGQVLGLSSTGGSSSSEYIFYIIGILWIWVGLKLHLASQKA